MMKKAQFGHDPATKKGADLASTALSLKASTKSHDPPSAVLLHQEPNGDSHFVRNTTEPSTMKLSTFFVASAAASGVGVTALSARHQQKNMNPVPFGGNRHWANGGAGQKKRADVKPEHGFSINGNGDYLQQLNFGGNRHWANGGGGIKSSRAIEGEPSFAYHNGEWPQQQNGMEAAPMQPNANNQGSYAPWSPPAADTGSGQPSIEAAQPSQYDVANTPAVPSINRLIPERMQPKPFGGNRHWATGGGGIRSSNGCSGKETFASSNHNPHVKWDCAK